MTVIKSCFILFFLFVVIGFAQSINGKCGTYAEQADIQNSINSFHDRSTSSISNQREISWIPIQVHIVTRTDGTGGLNENVIDVVLDQMNADFGQIEIQFYPVAAIDYIADSDYYFCDDDIEINQLKLINNTAGVIDIYTVGSLSSNDTPLCGISSFSWFDIQGLIIANSCFDRSTLSHEMGHFFNLFHPHETATGSEFVDGTDCDNLGDGICDTPADPDLSTPGYVQGCVYSGNAVDPSGQAYNDCQGYPPCEFFGGPDVENIMSYAPNVCVDHFTTEQYDKMEYVLFNNREDYILEPEFSDIHIDEMTFTDLMGDFDGVINPGETVQIEIVVFIPADWPTAANDLILTLHTPEPALTLSSDQFYITLLEPGQFADNTNAPFQIEVDPSAELRAYELTLNLAYFSSMDELYETDMELDFHVSINQAGFPVITDSDVESSPAVIDLDDDGFLDVLFGDFSGNFYKQNQDGLQTLFTAEGQIWGSPAVADLDFDGDIEIVIGSVDKYLYIMNADGSPQSIVYTDQFLVGTPAIGNLDSDADLEIVLGGFSNPGKVFAINPDGSNIPGFPLEINEKMKKGAALADVDGDGIDEIFIATEDDHLWKIKTDGSLVTSQILLTAEDKFRFAPVISHSADGFIIFCGSMDGIFYGVDPWGGQLFTVNTQDEITSSAGISAFAGGTVFFGSANGILHGIRLDGSSIPGWPQYTGESFSTAPVLADIDMDGNDEILIFSDSGGLVARRMDGSPVELEMNLDSELKGSPFAGDIDGDGDVEVLIGSENGIYGFDIKSASSTENRWNMYKGNLSRNGFLDLSSLHTALIPTPDNFQITGLYPNPFNSSFSIEFQLTHPGIVEFTLYTVTGRSVYLGKQFYSDLQKITRTFNLNQLASGPYIIEIKSENGRKFQRIALLK